jgi:hypothetical protein
VQQIPDYSDDRLKGRCIHCGGPNETRDHIPSKVLLDEPFPASLAASPSCLECNNSLSADEEYLACVLECVIAGDVNPKGIERSKIAHILARSPKLQERIRQGRQEGDGQTVWNIDQERVRRVLLKLARGHAAYELSEPQTDEPEFFWWKPLQTMTMAERHAFEVGPTESLEPWPEVGSRYMQRICSDGKDFGENGWLIVQPLRYRFKLSLSRGLRIQIIIREYLACEVSWD